MLQFRWCLLFLLPTFGYPQPAKTTLLEAASTQLGGMDACVTMAFLPSGSTLFFHEDRCAQRFSPASTFKIVNAIIGLETGVIPDEHFVIPWDGKKREFSGWNRDHDLASAIKVSSVPYFQELARRVGEERMQCLVASLNYGNQDISGGIDQFWLKGGGLAISANEQVAFLTRFLKHDLPISPRTRLIVRTILRQPQIHQGFYGKTGTAILDTKHRVGWFVGFLDLGSTQALFAINISGDETLWGFHARDKMIAILREMDLLPHSD